MQSCVHPHFKEIRVRVIPTKLALRRCRESLQPAVDDNYPPKRSLIVTSQCSGILDCCYGGPPICQYTLAERVWRYCLNQVEPACHASVRDQWISRFPAYSLHHSLHSCCRNKHLCSKQQIQQQTYFLSQNTHMFLKL